MTKIGVFEQGPQWPCLRNMRNKHRRCTHTRQTDPDFLTNTRRSLSTPGKPNWVSRKRLKVLNFPQPSTQKEMIQFLGLVNYFRDHATNITEKAKPLREMIPQGKYQRTSQLVWTAERSAAFQYYQQAISN